MTDNIIEIAKELIHPGQTRRLRVNLGEQVTKKQELVFITDVVGDYQVVVRASVPGIVLSFSLNPLVNQGDAIVHLAVVKVGCFAYDFNHTALI